MIGKYPKHPETSRKPIQIFIEMVGGVSEVWKFLKFSFKAPLELFFLLLSIVSLLSLSNLCRYDSIDENKAVVVEVTTAEETFICLNCVT